MFKEKLLREIEDLETKINNLNNFLLEESNLALLGESDIILLEKQCIVMEEYLSILRLRLK